MLKVFIGVLLMCATAFWNNSLSQTAPYSSLQSATPPSPEAISFARQTFSDVNLYAGKVSYTMPIYTLSQNGISFPISLSYSGGNGIKVEEVASSVGLGWTLQSTGVITRSARGGPDDRWAGDYRGYIHLPGIDTTYHDVYKPDHTMYEVGYDAGRYDSQPDIYFISAPGLSASFYINKLKKIVFVEKSDLQVKILFSGYTIIGFEVRDLNGNMYLFDVTETTKSIPMEGSSEYNLYDVSSWYLSKIVNSHGKTIFTFEYQDKELNHTTQLLRAPYQFTMFDQILASFDEDNSSYTKLYTKRPLLRKIEFNLGEVNFVASDSCRYDLANDRSIDSILVKDNTGKIIRQFNFDFSYFSSTGIIQEGDGDYYAEGDPSLRLKLDRLEIIGREDASQKETYSFIYNTSTLLPDRLSSFAMDHWGYYNGVNSNSTWEGRHRAKYYIPDSGMVNLPLLQLAEFGTANREPNAAFAKACILQEVIMPTGGAIQFEYEGHTSIDPQLPNTLSTMLVDYTVDEQKTYFTIDLIREPFAFVKVQAFAENGATIQYTIRDSVESMIPIIDTLMEGSTQHTHKLQSGIYYIKAKVITPHPDTSFNYGPRLIKDIETLVVNKPVGGVRIKQMTMADPVTNQSLTRNYYYNEAGKEDLQSLSTGTIGNVPVYGYQGVMVDPDYEGGSGEALILIQGYVRQLSTTYPLIGTNGSYTGYSKVTVIDNELLKSQYHFTSFKDFPECVDGYLGDALLVALQNTDPLDPVLVYNPNNTRTEINGEWYEHWPFAPSDERDHYRGKLKKEVSYRVDGDSHVKVAEKENCYIHNFGFVGKNQGVNLIFPEKQEYVVGMVGTDRNLSKSYILHTGKMDIYKTIEKNYSYIGANVDSTVTETTLDYGQTPWYRDTLLHYQVTKVIQQRSETTDSIRYYYPFDWRYNAPDISIADTAYLRKLEQQNRIGMPVIEKKFSNGVHTVTTKNIYSTFGNVFNPSIIQVKNGTASTFEDRIYFNKYDTLGNIIEQQKTNDVKSVYVWDYKLSYPVAQIVNADSAHVAYTSFEADGKGNWTFTGTPAQDLTSPTGKKCYTLGGNITKSGLSSTGTYIVSYWKKSGTVDVNGTAPTTGKTINGWTYHEHKVVNPAGGLVTISGTAGIVDELRLYPSGAQMTTYAYKPMVGITSSCDANNLVTYYEYDAFGRLTLVKDSEGNLLKQHAYHYQTSQPQQ